MKTRKINENEIKQLVNAIQNFEKNRFYQTIVGDRFRTKSRNDSEILKMPQFKILKKLAIIEE